MAQSSQRYMSLSAALVTLNDLPDKKSVVIPLELPPGAQPWVSELRHIKHGGTTLYLLYGVPANSTVVNTDSAIVDKIAASFEIELVYEGYVNSDPRARRIGHFTDALGEVRHVFISDYSPEPALDRALREARHHVTQAYKQLHRLQEYAPGSLEMANALDAGCKDLMHGLNAVVNGLEGNTR